MSDTDRIIARFDEVLHGPAWHGDPMWEILDGISAEHAAARPVQQAHTIWEIVTHMIFWEGVATRRLAGERAGLVEELNFPPTPTATEENWRKALDDLRVSNQAFREALGRLDPSQLHQLTAAGKRTFHGEAHGVIEHHVYHLGQIALLKKALA